MNDQDPTPPEYDPWADLENVPDGDDDSPLPAGDTFGFDAVETSPAVASGADGSTDQGDVLEFLMAGDDREDGSAFAESTHSESTHPTEEGLQDATFGASDPWMEGGDTGPLSAESGEADAGGDRVDAPEPEQESFFDGAWSADDALEQRPADQSVADVTSGDTADASFGGGDWTEGAMGGDGSDEEPFSFDVEPSSETVSSSRLPDDATDEEPIGAEAVLAAGAMAAAASVGSQASPAADERPKARPRPKKKQGGMGPILPTVLGGVLSIPIVIAILWALGKLPDFSRSGRREGGAPRQVARTMPTLQPRSLDSLGPAGSLDALGGGQPAAKTGAAEGGEAASPETKVAAAQSSADEAPATEEGGSPPDGSPESADESAPAAMKQTPPPATGSDASAGAANDAEPADASPPATEEPIGLDRSLLAAVVPAMPDPASAARGDASLSENATTDADPFGEPDESPSAAGVARPLVQEPAAPEPLDTVALEEAAGAAAEAFDSLQSVAADDPGRKMLLRDWYIALARLGEESARLEGVAIERGVPLGQSLADARRVVAAMIAEESVRSDMMRVAAVWMRANARPSDGVVFPAVMPVDASRPVGPWWITKLRPSDDPEAAMVTVIGREKPSAVEGDEVVVMGVILDGGVIWATECRPFGPEAADPGLDELFGDAVAGDGGSAADSAPDPEMPAEPEERPSSDEKPEPTVPSTDADGVPEPSATAGPAEGVEPAAKPSADDKPAVTPNDADDAPPESPPAAKPSEPPANDPFAE